VFVVGQSKRTEIVTTIVNGMGSEDGTDSLDSPIVHFCVCPTGYTGKHAEQSQSKTKHGKAPCQHRRVGFVKKTRGRVECGLVGGSGRPKLALS